MATATAAKKRKEGAAADRGQGLVAKVHPSHLSRNAHVAEEKEDKWKKEVTRVRVRRRTVLLLHLAGPAEAEAEEEAPRMEATQRQEVHRAGATATATT
jgi:hypothetical protein